MVELKQKIRDKFDSFVPRGFASNVSIVRQEYVHNPATQSAELQDRVTRTVGTFARTEDIFDDNGLIRQTARIIMVPAAGLRFAPQPGDLIRFPNGTSMTVASVDQVGPTPDTLLYRLSVT